MTGPRLRRPVCLAIASGLVLSAWGYLLPLTFQIRATETEESVFAMIGDGTIARSLLFATVASLSSVALGLGLAVHLRLVPASSSRARLLPLLLLPVLAGDLTVGFAFKALTIGQDWFSWLFGERQAASVMFALLVLQTWQYGLLCTYLFWLRIVSIERNVSDFGLTSGLTILETVRDVIWPRCRSLILLLLLVVFFAAVYESSKIFLVFRASAGMHGTLIAHDIWEAYRQRLNVDPGYAIGATLRICVVVAPLIFGGAAVLAGAQALGSDLLSRHLWRRGRRRQTGRAKLVLGTSRPDVGGVILVGLALAAVAPLLAPLFRFAPVPDVEWAALLWAAVLATAGSLPAVALAVVVAFTLRMAFPRTSTSLGQSMMLFLLALLALKSVPPLAFILSGLEWLTKLSDSSTAAISASWLFGQAFLSLPLLGSFAVWLHSQVSVTELEFQETAGLSSSGVLLRSFLSRFQLDYVFLFVFAWSLIWNEATLNRAVSDKIPTFVDLLSRRLSTRPDFGRASMLAMTSLFTAFGLVFFWTIVLARRSRREGA